MSRLPSVMSHSFAQTARADIPRSTFDRSHGYKTTFDAGYLVPIYCDEALPGDTFNLNMSGFARLATPLHPVMDNMYLDTFFFAVPKRLLWENWKRFNGEQDNPDDTTDFLVPTMKAPAVTGYTSGTLADYFAIPTGVPALEHSSLWHRAYNLIYNEWFRDQNLQDSVPFSKNDGPDLPADYKLLRRTKRHDYFTGALPFPQKGPSVSVPMSGNAALYGPNGSYLDQLYNPAGGTVSPITLGSSGSSVRGLNSNVPLGNTSAPVGIDLDGAYADMSAVAAATINQLRQAFQIQKMYERDARGGTRYIEIIKSHFGVESPDARQQRPEYLGGGSTPISINPVAATASTATAPQGNLAGVGTAMATGHGFNKSFTEHCVIIGLANVRADLTYQQGLDRMWSRSTRFDFYWPALSHLGEQAILNKEIYTQGTVADEDVFGYQERFAEYRYKPSRITGKFRSNDPQSLDLWHLSQNFGNLPVLGDTFIEDRPPIDRIIAVQNEPHFLFDSYFSLTCARPMPVHSTPGLIDHF